MPITCTTCGAPAMAVKPGTNGISCELLGQVVPIKRGEPDEAWCESHWKARFGARQPALFGEKHT